MEQIMDLSNGQTYDRYFPFLATIKDRYRLNHPGSSKHIYHIVLDVTGSGIDYQVGDSVGVIPHNCPQLVKSTLRALKMSGSETVVDPRTQLTRSLEEYLQKSANITKLNRSILQKVCESQPDPKKQNSLLEVLAEGKREEFSQFIETRQLWDFLQENMEVQFQPQVVVELLSPLLPRFYSIASSKKAVGSEVHLTVALTEFEANSVIRRGVGSNFLCHLAPMAQPCIPIYLHPSNGFTLPNDEEAPIIMVGPGTGIAPFRGFMQERLASGGTGRSWLFFGERHREHDFLYNDFWVDLEKLGLLRLACAFSRDQSEKVYVQHKLLEHGREVWGWLKEGAHFYVCGDASSMAKEVEQTLLKIIEEHGKMTAESAKAHLKTLKKEKRYLRDVY